MANKIVCDYEVIERTGGGGFGATYKAQHVHLPGRVRAVKLVDEAYVDAFKESGEKLAKLVQALDEASTAGDALAAYIVRFDSLRYDVDQPYIVMEWIDGGTLDDRLAGGALPLDRAVSILSGVLHGLQFAHARDLVHGDLKPSNILLAADDSPKLTDFGGNLTGEGISPAPGSLPYLSPEQLDPALAQDRPPDARADLFAATLILYEMLTGRRAPRVITASQMPSRVNPRMPAGFDDLIAQGLEHNPGARFPDAQTMRELVLHAAGMVGAPAAVGVGAEPATEATDPEETEEGTEEAAEGPREAGESRANEVDGGEMVWVPAGTLRMGCDDCEDEAPSHEVEVDGFWIYKRPVTQEQWVKFKGATTEPGVVWPRPAQWERGDEHASLPVAGVTWEEATAYCKWAGARLPTEAEWEWAACGPESAVYPWGDTWDESKANTKENGQFEHTETGTAGNSWCDAQDMSGNVFEWCSSLFQPYPYDPEDGREDPEAAGDRVLRGGSATTDAHCARASYRCAPNPLARLTSLRPVQEG